LDDSCYGQLLFSTTKASAAGPTSLDYRPVPPAYVHGLTVTSTMTFLGKAEWSFRFSPSEDFVTRNNSSDRFGVFHWRSVVTVVRYPTIVGSLCGVTRKVVLAVGLTVTIIVSVVIPWMLLSWRQRQQEAAARAEARIAKETFSQTLGIVCHELRNPVHALKGLLVMIAEDVRLAHLPGLLSELATAQGCVGTMQSVLDDVLEMQRHDVVRLCRDFSYHYRLMTAVGGVSLDSASQTTLTPRLSPADVIAVVRDVANRSRNDMKPTVRFSVVTARDLTSSEVMLDQLHVRMVCVVSGWRGLG
jgi:signal transduction histidine kinase